MFPGKEVNLFPGTGRRMELKMGTLLYIVLCVLKFKVSETHTKCFTQETGKKMYGNSCSDNTQCLTEYCGYTTCSCPFGSVLDSKTGFCVRSTGDNMIMASNGDCGYIVSTREVYLNTVVQWDIIGDTDTYVTLVILEVNMNTFYCSSNYVEVLEGSTMLRGPLCTSNDYTAKYQASKSSRLTIKYRGTYGGDQGFRAVYFIRNNSAVLTEPTGYIASPGYPLNYKGNSKYSWLITARPGQVITLSTTGSTQYLYDYVYIYDGQYEFNRLKSHTGQWSMQSVTSTSNYMLVVLSTTYSWSSSSSNYSFSGSYQVYGVLYGESCNITDTCIQGLTCLGGVCGCLASQYYDQTTCKSRLSAGAFCYGQDVCAQSLVCSGSYCRCQDSQYYDKSSMTCKQTLNVGEQCDPTMEDMCASRDFVCRRQTLNTTMYTCLQACTSDSIDKKTFLALIVVAAVGWAVAIVAVVSVIILCLRNQKRSAPYRGGIVIREATEARSNDYRTCPPRPAQDPLQNGNKEEQNATTSGQSTLTIQTTNTAQPAVPATDALENKPVVPARPPVPPKNALGVKQPEASSTPTFINTSFEPDSKDEDGIIYETN
ncbi:deleted in malignant brain tumors 1 protein [Biomphalaria glabrata]|nr:deleted in malignant brain tumors 1 protein [Biomphalaria glabrata]